MGKLCVFDFDNTLIPYDSFKQFLIFLVKQGRIDIGWLIVLRVCRIISSTSFKQKIHSRVEKSSKLQGLSHRFAKILCDDIVWPRQFINLLRSEKVDDLSVNILSASPDCYLKWLTLSIEIDNIQIPVSIFGSSYFNGRFVEMYGNEKLKFINQHYTPEVYQYYYAISDSQSDLCWMKLFNHYEIIKL